jgi:hypothetical protein
LRRHGWAALPGGHVPLAIWARQRVFAKQIGVDLRPPGSRKKFAVIAVK